MNAQAGRSQDGHNQFSTWHYSFCTPALALLGRRAESLEFLKEYEKVDAGVPYHVGLHRANMVYFHNECGEIGDPVDQEIERFRSIGLSPVMTPQGVNHFWVHQAYTRLAQLLAIPKDDRARFEGALKKLRLALKELKSMAIAPILKSHALAIEGATLRLEGKCEKALELLSQAEQVALEANNILARFEIAKHRAHALRNLGYNEGCLEQAKLAQNLALEHGWVHRAKSIRTEFPGFELSLSEGASNTPRSASNATAQSRSTLSQIQLQRQMDALLELSIASASVLDPSEVVQIALAKIVKLMGAERAFLFLSDEKTGDVSLTAGRDQAEMS